MKTDTLTVRSRKRADAIDITERVDQLVRESGVADGVCHVYVAHTTAAVFINENADPDVPADLLDTLDRLVPWDGDYRHAEGNAAAHIKATLVGTSQSIPIRDGRLRLGRWQGIFVADFDGPRERTVRVAPVASDYFLPLGGRVREGVVGRKESRPQRGAAGFTSDVIS